MPTGADQTSHASRVAAAAQREIVGFTLPAWYRTVGRGAWLALGIVGVIAVALVGIALVAEVAIPLAIAAVPASILVPLTDRLKRWHLPRWLGATLVLILGLSLAAGTVALVVSGITSRSDEMWNQLEAALQRVDDNLGSTPKAPPHWSVLPTTWCAC